MSSTHTTSSASSTQESVSAGDYSGTSHSLDSNTANLAQISIASEKAQISSQTFNQLITSLKPFANSLLVAASKITSEKISEIAGPVWEEFKALTPFQKLLVVLATAVIVGAVGYFSWKLIRGNWETIKKFMNDQMKKLEAVKEYAAKSIEKNLYFKKVVGVFEKQVENTTISEDDVKKIIAQFYECGGKGFLEAFVELLKYSKV